VGRARWKPSWLKACDHPTKRPRLLAWGTLVGEVAFGKNGEWAKSRVLQAQFRGIKGNSVDQFKKPDSLARITPTELKSGEVTTTTRRPGNRPSHAAHTKLATWHSRNRLGHTHFSGQPRLLV